MKNAPRKLRGMERVALAIPYLWMAFFFLVPFVIVARISLSTAALSMPPYEPQLGFEGGWAGIVEKLSQLGLDAYRALLADDIYLLSYLGSLRLAAISTAATLLVAYPFALGMARADRRWRPLLILLAIAPFWTSFLIRVYAWMAILKDEGLLNHALIGLGLISEPLRVFATETAVVIGIVYSYLPFMVLPIYAALEAQNQTLVEAAQDLGSTPLRAFWKVTFPLSLPGVMAGVLLVFIPAVGEFVIPDLLGGTDTLMIGRTIWNEFFSNRDWPAASAIAVVLLCVLVPLIVMHQRRQAAEGAR